MEQKELGTKLLEDCSVEDVIDYFGDDVIANELNDAAISKCINVHNLIMSSIDDDDLVEAMSDVDSVLDVISIASIRDNLSERGFEVIESEEELTIMERLRRICCELKPRGYIEKEEAKQLICQYMDDWMTRGFFKK